MDETKLNQSDWIVRASNISVEYEIPTYRVHSFKEYVIRRLRGQIKKSTFRALSNVNIQVKKGESVALLGHNGSGKSTLLKVVAGIIEPPGALVEVRGRIAPMIELGAGFDHELDGVSNIRLSCMLMGLSATEIDEKIESIIRFAELEDFIQMPIKNFSSGMQARLGFACATAVDPDLLLVDEVLSVGDANFGRKCLERIERLRSLGTSVILVSHDPATVARFCDRAYVFRAGKCEFEGEVTRALAVHSSIMEEKYFERLAESERQEYLRKNTLEMRNRLEEIGIDRSEKPFVSVLGARIQQSKSTKRVESTSDSSKQEHFADFLEPFQIQIDFVLSKTEHFDGEIIVGIGWTNKAGTRLWGANTQQQRQKIEFAGLQDENYYTLTIPYTSGLPNLFSGEYVLQFAIHDRSLTRTIFCESIMEITGQNSDLGSSVDGDVLPYSKLTGPLSIAVNSDKAKLLVDTY